MLAESDSLAQQRWRNFCLSNRVSPQQVRLQRGPCSTLALGPVQAACSKRVVDGSPLSRANGDRVAFGAGPLRLFSNPAPPVVSGFSWACSASSLQSVCAELLLLMGATCSRRAPEPPVVEADPPIHACPHLCRQCSRNNCIRYRVGHNYHGALTV